MSLVIHVDVVLLAYDYDGHLTTLPLCKDVGKMMKSSTYNLGSLKKMGISSLWRPEIM